MTAIAIALQRRLAKGAATRELTVGDLEPFGDGHSGFTYRVALGERAAVLRLSPPGSRIVGPADVGRQGRIMAALSRSGLPAPVVIDCSSEPIIDGRAFVLMELVPGVSFEEARRDQDDWKIAAAAVTAARQFHALDPEASHLSEIERFDAAAETERWARLLPRGPAGLRDVAAPLVAQLQASVPPPSPPRLVHGDYHYGNLLFEDTSVTAIVDWEIASLGEPLSDLGCLAVASLRRRYAPEPNPTGGLEVTAAQLAELYGAEPVRAAWFCAQSCLKYAAIIGYNLELHRSGRREDEIYEQLQGTMLGLPQDGIAFLQDGLNP